LTITESKQHGNKNNDNGTHFTTTLNKILIKLPQLAGDLIKSNGLLSTGMEILQNQLTINP